MNHWMRFSKKLSAAIEQPKHAGVLTQEIAEERSLRLVVGREEKAELGKKVHLFWLVNEDDGIISEATFQVLGPPSLVGAAEALCTLVVKKNYDQALRIGADLLDKQMADKSANNAFPKEVGGDLNLVLAAVEDAARFCTDIPFTYGHDAPPLSSDFAHLQETGEVAGWLTLPPSEQIAIVEKVIATDIRPYIELDAGGVHILNLIQGREVIIKYEGACTTCYSSTGATLNAIEHILRTKVHPALVVIPDLTP